MYFVNPLSPFHRSGQPRACLQSTSTWTNFLNLREAKPWLCQRKFVNAINKSIWFGSFADNWSWEFCVISCAVEKMAALGNNSFSQYLDHAQTVHEASFNLRKRTRWCKINSQQLNGRILYLSHYLFLGHIWSGSFLVNGCHWLCWGFPET